MKLSANVPLAAITLALIGCMDGPRNKSPESELLRSRVVPQLVAWAKSDSKELALGKIEALQAFDHICFLWEYQRYDKIEETIQPIREYFGSYGVIVPENEIAFVGVRNGFAHTAHIQADNFPMGRGRRCVATRKARLVKESNASDDMPRVKLEETQ